MAAKVSSIDADDRSSIMCPPAPAGVGHGEAVAGAASRSSGQSMAEMVALLFNPVPSPDLLSVCRPESWRDPRTAF